MKKGKSNGEREKVIKNNDGGVIVVGKGEVYETRRQRIRDGGKRI